MPKPRTKRGTARDEKKRKRHEEEDDKATAAKRHRQADDGPTTTSAEGHEGQPPPPHAHDDPEEKEFFGMLSDEEQEYFRRTDELLELNQFTSTEDRNVFLESVFHEAQEKELKLASSQSCSRLMERLIQLSSTAQKKRLFEAFGGHFLSLVQHRFASHCCEALFLRSANVVTEELAGFAGFVLDKTGADTEEQKPEASMEDLFLATLDELEPGLSYLITDRFASHTLRVLLVVLSGRPLDDAAMRSLLRSKKKERVAVAGAGQGEELGSESRAVPGSFAMAVSKIIGDCTSSLDATSLRVLAKHPIGNPTLQLLLELDLASRKDETRADSTERHTLLYQLLPGAPHSLSDDLSQASEFVNGMVYEPIGARLIETILVHGPAKIFRALKHNIFLPRIQSYARNDVASYAAIRVLNRLGKDDLIEATEKILPSLPQLVAKTRFNVIRTLFERCAARGANDQIKKLMKGLKESCNTENTDIVTSLCCLGDSGEEKKQLEQLTRNEYAIQSHGAQLLTTLLSIPGPVKAVQEAILSLQPDTLVRIAKTSLPTVSVLTTALATPSANPAFHKSLVSTILPHIPDLANSQFGHNLVAAVAEVPSRGKERSVPPHIKEAVMETLGQHEQELRESWMGRSVWRSWKGDMWKTRRGDWKAWLREVGIDDQKGGAHNPVVSGQGKADMRTGGRNAKNMSKDWRS